MSRLLSKFIPMVPLIIGFTLYFATGAEGASRLTMHRAQAVANHYLRYLVRTGEMRWGHLSGRGQRWTNVTVRFPSEWDGGYGDGFQLVIHWPVVVGLRGNRIRAYMPSVLDRRPFAEPL